MNFFSHLPESDLAPVPQFYVEPPDKRRDWPELDRQATFRRLMQFAAPRVVVEANPLAGKRNPALAKKEGITAGVFDLDITFKAPLAAHIEMKGFSKSGRAGMLSKAQIEWGNRRTELGWPVACFFSPYAAVAWLRELGFPVSKAVG